MVVVGEGGGGHKKAYIIKELSFNSFTKSNFHFCLISSVYKIYH